MILSAISTVQLGILFNSKVEQPIYTPVFFNLFSNIVLTTGKTTNIVPYASVIKH